MIVIKSDNDAGLAAAAALLNSSRKTVALTGAGISVGSGIPDFRSPGGLWSVYAPDEYATLEVFYRNPQKAWELYRALGNTLLGKISNPAHQALAELESQGRLAGIVTQNVDNLHQQAGSRTVLEIHGDHQHLQCLECGHLEEVREQHYREQAIPRCPTCSVALKPNVVLFGEPVRQLPREFHPEETPPTDMTGAEVFCPGCLVVGGPPKGDDPGAAARYARHPAFSDWPLVVLTDEPSRAARSTMNFLWTTFTRFEPAADVHAASVEVVRNHVSYTPPVVIDARLRPGFPDELFCDPETASTVERRWTEYFPDGGVEMGDSDRAHLD